MRVAVFAVFLFLLAGCQQAAPNPPTGIEPDFDGDAAYDFVAGLVTENGEPRYRHPGSPGHASGADWLESSMAVSGWSTTRQTFTGTDYLLLDRSATSSWNNGCGEESSEVADFTFHNLYATYNAGAQMLWLGAHWDSKEDSYDGGHVLGANDGASGVGLLLQLMRHVSAGDLEVPYGLGVVFFDGEDGFEDCHPLAGSQYFVQTLEEGLVDRFILLDMVGDANARFPIESNSQGSDSDLVEILWSHGRHYAPDSFTNTIRPVSDDHIPFIEAGIPAVDIIDYDRPSTRFPPYWHTSGDTMDNIDAAMLEAVGKTVWASMLDPDFVATWN